MRLRLVFLTVFVIAACGLGYELVAGALASYLLGDSVAQFSTAIGLYLFALGVGAWLSKFVGARLVHRFVDLQCAIAVLGGTSAAVLFLAFASGRWFRPVLYGEILSVGTLVGLEIPLLLRILKDEMDFKDLVSRVLTFDYVGSLLIALAFPMVLVPRLGLVRTAMLLGLLNAFVGLWSTYIFEERLPRPGGLRLRAALSVAVLSLGMAFGEHVTFHAETTLFADEVLYARSTPYQRIVVTGNDNGFALWLNGALQFSSADEYRYHEALVHPAMALSEEPRRVLVLGGGDGLAVREVLKHKGVEKVVLVDIDPAMTGLSGEVERLAVLSGRSLADPRVTVVNDDAMRWLDGTPGLFDVAIVDFPDPASFAVGKLYTTRFYERLQRVLAPDGVAVVQSTSPFHARRSFWCVVRTLEASGLATLPYRAFVPSFRGDWGFVLASRRQLAVPPTVLPGLRSLDVPSMQSMFVLPPDLGPVEVEVNRLDNQVLVRTYEEEAKSWS